MIKAGGPAAFTTWANKTRTSLPAPLRSIPTRNTAHLSCAAAPDLWPAHPYHLLPRCELDGIQTGGAVIQDNVNLRHPRVPSAGHRAGPTIQPQLALSSFVASAAARDPCSSVSITAKHRDSIKIARSQIPGSHPCHLPARARHTLLARGSTSGLPLFLPR